MRQEITYFDKNPKCLECGKPSPTYMVHIKCMKKFGNRKDMTEANKRLKASERTVVRYK